MRRKGAFLTLVILVFATATLASVASAHTPIFLQSTTTGVKEHAPISDPEHSWAVYGRLPAGAAADAIPIQAKKGQRLYLQLLVPDKPDLASFKPQVVLLGPRLRGEVPPSSPVRPPSGEGALVVPNPPKPSRIYEGFTQMHLLEYGTVDSTFPDSGRYLLVAYDPAQEGGPYTVAIGKRESFGLLDVLNFPLVWARAHVWLWK